MQTGQSQWLIPAIPAGRLRQENCHKVEAILNYTVGPCFKAAKQSNETGVSNWSISSFWRAFLLRIAVQSQNKAPFLTNVNCYLAWEVKPRGQS